MTPACRLLQCLLNKSSECYCVVRRAREDYKPDNKSTREHAGELRLTLMRYLLQGMIELHSTQHAQKQGRAAQNAYVHVFSFTAASPCQEALGAQSQMTNVQENCSSTCRRSAPTMDSL